MRLASEMRKAGISVEIVDGIMQNLRVDDIKRIIKDSSTRIFGLTMFQANYRIVMEVISYIKKTRPDNIVFSGGTYASIVYEKKIDDWINVFFSFSTIVCTILRKIV